MKNEIKYKIPERWTRPFYKHDIVGRILADEHFSAEERGRVNKNAQGLVNNRLRGMDGIRGSDQTAAAVLQNQYLQQSMPLNNTAFLQGEKPQSAGNPTIDLISSRDEGGVMPDSPDGTTLLQNNNNNSMISPLQQ